MSSKRIGDIKSTSSLSSATEEVPLSMTSSEHERFESSGDHTHGRHQKNQSQDSPSHHRSRTNKKNRKEECSSSSTCLLDDGNFVAQPLLKQRLGYLFEKQKFTDVVFLVGKMEERVEAHRTILASASLTFQKLLYESTSVFIGDCGKFVVLEPDLFPASFKVFVKAIYTNEIPICLNLSMSLEVYNLTEKYSVKFLQDEIVSHIQNSVTVSNVFEALKVSTSTFRLTCMIPVCWRMVEEDTSAVLEYHIDSLDQSTFTRILERDQLNLKEVELFQFMVKWAASQCKRRALKTTGRNKRQMLEPLLKYIRFSSMPLSTFNDIVLPSRILEPKEIHDIISHFNKHPPPSENGKIPAKMKMKHKVRKMKSSVDISKLDLFLSANASDSAIAAGQMKPTTASPKLRPRKNNQQKVQRVKRGSVTHR